MTQLSDQEIADALTYALNSWGNSGGAVAASQVAAERAKAAATTKKPTRRPSTRRRRRSSSTRAPRADHVGRLEGARDAGRAGHDDGRVRPGAEDLLRALRRLPRRAAQGRDGKPLTPDITQKKGTEYLKVFINQAPRPACRAGQVRASSRPPTGRHHGALRAARAAQPPEYGLREIKGHPQGAGPVDSGEDQAEQLQHRQTSSRHAARLRARRADRRRHKQIINVIKTGYAVHISRSRTPGATSTRSARRQDRPDRPVHCQAGPRRRDQGRLEARSVETSKYKGTRPSTDRRLVLAAAVTRSWTARHSSRLKVV